MNATIQYKPDRLTCRDNHRPMIICVHPTAAIMADRLPPNHHGFKVPLWQRKPQRISITLPEATYNALLMRSSREGRSISNLAAFLLEREIARNAFQPGHRSHGDDHRQAA
jgi:hypothetical protein